MTQRGDAEHSLLSIPLYDQMSILSSVIAEKPRRPAPQCHSGLSVVCSYAVHFVDEIYATLRKTKDKNLDIILLKVDHKVNHHVICARTPE